MYTVDFHRIRFVILIAAVISQWPLVALAHGIAGKRIFPATLTVDDPAVADEADFQFSQIKVPGDEGDAATNISALSMEWAKRITQNLGFSLGTAYLGVKPDGATQSHGFDNASLGIKYRMGVDPDAETLWSIGLDADLGGTGSMRVGAESFSTFTPTVYFGKGFGNLSEEWLQPAAVTGVVGVAVPSRTSESKALEWGLTFQYDLHYLQSYVKDEGIPAPFDHMTPIIELPMETCLDHGCSGQTSGYVNPGVIWGSHWGQIAVEAQVPVNKRTGNETGILVQLHFFLDDIFPDSLGRPLVEG